VGLVAQGAETGDVVGMQMRIDRLDELEVKLVNQLQIAIDLLQNRDR
jgi:midasin (ATPase involved in ribosome maturation)